MKDTIVLYPNIARGHLISMVELGKLILSHHPSFSITILILTPPTNTTTSSTTTTISNSNAQYMATVTATTPAITFIHIPAPPPFSDPSFPPHLLSVELSLRSTQNVAVALKSLAKTSNIKALVMDFMNFNDPKTLTEKLNTDVPTYFYFTSGASTLAVLLLFHNTLKETVSKNKPLEIIQIPGLPTMSIDDLPKEGREPSSQSFQMFLQIANNMKGSVGIIINTFEAIEENVIKVLTDDGSIPPLYCIGPVISSPYGEEDKGCMSWLDSQPSQSVVLLCFGSMGRFSGKQIKEIAIGLEKSEQRFLWVVRTELSESDSDELELSLEELMPEGFLERTKEKGLVVRDWAPQAEILSHNSVGGFVTHCGWNSVLEAVCEGVPMVAWPLYAEQKVNRVILVKEMKVALALKENEDGFVSWTELGDRVRELMESDKGKDVRQRIFKMKISAKEARQEGGTSRVALDKLATLWKHS